MTRKYTLKPDKSDLRDLIFRSTSISSLSSLPKSIDLREKLSPVVDQGQLGSCTANAIASGLREYLLLQAGSPLVRLSRLFLYWHERQMEGTTYEDSGAYIRDGMKVLTSIGVPSEQDYPYDITRFTDRPTAQAEADASAFKISSYHRVTDLNALKVSLYEGLPVVAGIKVYSSFESEKTARTGMVTIPKKGEEFLGGHAVLIVGYKKIGNTEYLIVRNSWGEDWGDKGYFYMPSSFIQRGLVTDMWTGK
jgi:C1A family cysteine protease